MIKSYTRQSFPTQLEKHRSLRYTRGYPPTDGQVAIERDYWQMNGIGLIDQLVQWRNPDYRLLVQRGRDAGLPYKRREVTEFRPCLAFGEVLVKGKFINPYTFDEYHTDDSTLWPSTLNKLIGKSDPTLRDVALRKIKRKVASRTKGFESIAPVAELRELKRTANSLVFSCINVVQALIDLKKRRPKSAGKRAADLWLTWSFGVKPLVSDVANLVQAISAWLAQNDETIRLSSSATKAWVEALPNENLTGPAVYGVKWFLRSQVAFELKYSFVCAHNFKLLAANDYTLVDHLGLQPPALVPALWELTAFSWVADYFGTLGEYLEDTFSGNGKLLYVSEGRKLNADVSFSASLAQSPRVPGTIVLRDEVRQGRAKYFEFERVVGTTLPDRIVRFKTLNEMGANGVNRLLNLAGVLAGGRSATFKKGPFNGFQP